MNEWDVSGRMLAALVAGGLIGLERTYRGRAAGMRTYALVAFGSALLVAAAQYDLVSLTHGDGDPTRVIQGIVTGIGFLGAGVIVKEGFSVHGLTSAASIWAGEYHAACSARTERGISASSDGMSAGVARRSAKPDVSPDWRAASSVPIGAIASENRHQ